MDTSSPTARRALLAGAVGSVIEWYDFAVFGAFAPVLARVFFPEDDAMAALLRTFAIFGVGFLARPLGAVVFGTFGDRIGRRRTLMIAVVAMSIPTMLMALLPTPAQIGSWAAILLVGLRLLQGVSTGGEVGGAYTYLGEQAGPGRYARAINWGATSTTLGLLLGTTIGFTISTFMPMDTVDAWGWRLAFALSLPLLIGAYIARRKLTETPEFEAVVEHREVVEQPVRTALRSQPLQLLRAVLLLGYSLGGYYFVATFVPAYLQMHDGISFPTALLITSVSLVALIIVYRFSAALSDRIGARQTCLIGIAVALVLGVPIWLMLSASTVGVVLLGGILFALLHGVFGVPSVTIVSRNFPTNQRYVCHSLAQNVAGAIFGGGAAFAATWLMMATGSNLAPIGFLLALALLALPAALAFPRFAPNELAPDDA